jgi:phage terminase large subunit-like protein
VRPLRRLPPDTDIRAFLLSLSPARRALALRLLGAEHLDAIHHDWPFWRHSGQVAPEGDWRTWVIMAGRGFGKTRAGAEWVRAAVKAGPPLNIALVAATLDDARKVMIDGRSGLLTIAGAWIDDWFPSRGILTFANGSEARLFSGASPEMLRGPEHHIAWCDELSKWEKPRDTWDMLQFSMRLGEQPQVLVTTTPKPGPVLRRILDAKGTILTRGSTRQNPHLPDAYVETVEDLYGGTRLGRQEIEGELLSDTPGALWTPELLERCRISPAQAPLGEGDRDARRRGGGVARLEPGDTPPPLFEWSPSPSSAWGGDTRIAIGVDPPVGSGTCGIVACARDADGVGHVLADHSVTATSPEGWARAVASAARLHAIPGARPPVIVAEDNQGGRMVGHTLHGVDRALHVKPVTARLSKAERAVPVAQRFEAGKVRLHGRLPELEAELCGIIAGGAYEGPGTSPDRADAMVWALTELMLGGERPEPRVRGL